MGRVSARYDPRLSGLRGLAAVMVAMLHVVTYGAIPAYGIVYTVYRSATTGFWIGVPVFLMLSIYLLLKSLDTQSSLRRYFSRRIRRIWPIYFGSIILIFVVFQSSYHLSLSDYVGFFTFTEYYSHPSIWGPLGVFWTLQLEEAAYVCIPFVHRSQHKEWIALGLVLISASWVCLLYSTRVLFAATGWSLAYLWFSPPSWLAAYGLGILVYTGRFDGPRSKALRWLAPLSLCLAAVALPFSLGPLSQEYQVFYPIALLGFAAVLANPPAFFRYFALVGEGSYAMYAGHIAFLLVFGLYGIPLILLSSLLVEIALRPKEVSSRLNIVFYGDRSTEAIPKDLPVPR